MQCDETRPQCVNCVTAGRDCKYLTPWTGPGRSSSDRSASPQVPSPASASTPAPASAVFPGLNPASPAEEPHSNVDMVHMELLHHYITDESMYPLVDGSMKDIIMATALREPFVMHSVLALSAHHLGVVRPAQSRFYHNLAIQLQTRALSLFNSIDVSQLEDSIEKRIPVFIFSCVIGFHALCDMLSHRDGDFGAAMARYLQYLRLHRGIHNVMQGHWDSLRQTELKVIFDDMVPQWFQANVEGRECDGLRERIRSAGLDAKELEAAERAIDLVQWVFDARPSPTSRAYVLCAWAVMLGRPFACMLEAGRPEALAVLAYFFLALHHCREVWMIGGAGQYLLTLLADHFRGGEWYAWVEPPYRMLQESLERAASDGARTASDDLASHRGQ